MFSTFPFSGDTEINVTEALPKETRSRGEMDMKTTEDDPCNVTWSITDLCAKSIAKTMKEGVALPLPRRASTLVSALVSQGCHNTLPQTWWQ